MNIIKVHRNDLQVGDIVISDDKKNHYVILNKRYTFLHDHIYYDVFYLYDSDNKNNDDFEHNKKWFSHELKEFKEVIRFN